MSNVKAESLHFNHILIVGFKIHCGRVQRQNYEHRVFIQLIIDVSMCHSVTK